MSKLKQHCCNPTTLKHPLPFLFLTFFFQFLENKTKQNRNLNLSFLTDQCVYPSLVFSTVLEIQNVKMSKLKQHCCNPTTLKHPLPFLFLTFFFQFLKNKTKQNRNLNLSFLTDQCVYPSLVFSTVLEIQNVKMSKLKQHYCNPTTLKHPLPFLFLTFFFNFQFLKKNKTKQNKTGT